MPDKNKLMEITTLENVPMTEITRAFNDGFSDYFVKFNATEEYLTNRWRGGRVNLSLSAGGWLDGKLVGILISGIDTWEGKLTAYNAATGVAPEARGNHFTTKAYDFLIPKFKEIGIEQMTLEVIQHNEKAIPIYERVGFKIDRGLSCFSGEPKIRQVSDIEGVELEISNRLDLEKAILFHDYEPAWESTFLALLMNWDQYEVYKLIQNSDLLGYAVVNFRMGQIYSFAIHPNHRRKGLGTFLFSKINEQFPKLKLNNVDDRDTGTLEFLNSIQLPFVINQYEMKMQI